MATGFSQFIEALRLGFTYQSIAERYGIEAVKTSIVETIATSASGVVVSFDAPREKVAA